MKICEKISPSHSITWKFGGRPDALRERIFDVRPAARDIADNAETLLYRRFERLLRYEMSGEIVNIGNSAMKE